MFTDTELRIVVSCVGITMLGISFGMSNGHLFLFIAGGMSILIPAYGSRG